MEKFKPKGYLEVVKVFEDGTEEVHFSEKNVITSGMGVGLSHLFAGSGGGTISDFQILNFQVGTGGDTDNYGTSSYKLNTPLTGGATSQYLTAGSEILLEDLKPIQNKDIKASTEGFVRIPYSNIQKVTPTSVRFNLILDRYTANGLSTNLDEIGLFMRNPRGLSPVAPILVAYRPFTGLKKTSNFALLFKWTINF
tara:strand:+ start:526 stop:1113 length:588 start_codon:yes stop_codon:yes gene_type:complete